MWYRLWELYRTVFRRACGSPLADIGLYGAGRYGAKFGSDHTPLLLAFREAKTRRGIPLMRDPRRVSLCHKFGFPDIWGVLRPPHIMVVGQEKVHFCKRLHKKIVLYFCTRIIFCLFCTNCTIFGTFKFIFKLYSFKSLCLCNFTFLAMFSVHL